MSTENDLDDDLDYEYESSSSSRTVVILLIVASLLLAGLAGFMYYKKTESESSNTLLISEKAKIEGELNNLEDKLVSIQDTLAASIEEKTQLQKDIGRLRRKLYNASVNKKLIADLRSEVSGLQIQVTKLKLENSRLSQLNKKLMSKSDSIEQISNVNNEKLSGLQKKNRSLQRKIKKASIIKVGSINIQTIRIKNSGKELNELRARKVDQIKVIFSIAQNDLTPSGEYQVFLRLVDPNGTTLIDDGAEPLTISIEQEIVPFTRDLNIIYKAGDTNPPYPVNYDIVDELIPGVYTLIIYSDQAEMGRETFELN